MPKYRARFTETCTYEVEFETDEVLDIDSEDGIEDEQWFEPMDAQDEDWFKRPQHIERELDSLELIEDAPVESETR